ncbi:MAG: alpha/beta hydrolase [bacterium]|nr:alpha/beta hydrolase [bacterium]
MKRFSIVMAAAALSVVGCSGDPDPAQSTSSPTSSPPTTVLSTTVAPTTSTTTTETPVESSPVAIQIERDISYGPDERQVLDVMYRDDLVDAPIALIVHGGGWKSGDKTSEHIVAEFFVEHGFVAAMPNYRLTKEGGTNGFPIPIEDVACAAEWIHKNATEYGADPSTMLATGYSAGAHISALLSVYPERDWLQDCPLQDGQASFDAFIGFAGPYDFEVQLPEPAGCQLLYNQIGPGCDKSNPALWAEANPIDHVTADDPPTLLLGADHDCIVSSLDPDTGLCTDSYERMNAALVGVGVAVDLFVIETGTHGDMGVDIPPINWTITDFLKRHGFPTATPSPIAPLDSDFDNAAAPEQAILGVWNTSTNHPFALVADGTWILFSKIVKLPWTWGTWVLDGDMLTLATADDTPPLCHGAMGSYEVAVSANEELLHLTLVEDACPARTVELAGGPYERVPDMMVPGYLK